MNNSLYMKEFYQMREKIGCVELYSVKNTLYENLYDKMKPKEKKKEAEKVVKDIQEKTIHMLKKEDHARQLQKN